MADGAGAVVASLEYRFTPEHRLLATYDDAVEAFHYIRTSKDEWLTLFVDYSKCYLMGNSAGGMIAYHVSLRAAAGGAGDLKLLKIQGLILRQPYIGGTKRSESELRLENDEDLALHINDLTWELALLVGVDHDHEYCNPMAMDGGRFEKVRDHGWRVLVSGNGGNPLVDREKELVKLIEEMGVIVVSGFQDEGCHGVEFAEPRKAKQLIDLVKGFIS